MSLPTSRVPVPPPLWTRFASYGRGTLRIILVVLPASVHYVLTLNHMPIAERDDMDSLVRLAEHEWAERGLSRV